MDPNGVAERVEARIRGFFEEKRAEATEMAEDSVELVDAVFELTLRGGKRLRPIVVEAAHRAIRPSGDPDATVDVGAAIEMLQTFLLVHDDWMDGDEDRRGGRSVWAKLRDRHGDAHLGASLAILAGDLAAVYAHELLFGAPFPAEARDEALSTFLRMEREVFFGQQLDLVGSDRVERMYDLKTASYTTRGPLRLGALLAGAGGETLEALDRFARPLGIAFQLRDELLGTFGDPAVTGKPAGNDLRAGKRTVAVEAMRAHGSREQLAAVERAFGRRDATEAELAAATEALVAAGARARVEARLEERLAEARNELGRMPFDARPLEVVLDRLAFRDH
jgi:geranylgeranyl diphosphate synthase type I